MKVVIMTEQYLITDGWGEIKDKKTEQMGDRIYDVLSLENPETGEQRQAWFDVTALYDFRRRKQEAAAAASTP